MDRLPPTLHWIEKQRTIENLRVCRETCRYETAWPHGDAFHASDLPRASRRTVRLIIFK